MFGFNEPDKLDFLVVRKHRLTEMFLVEKMNFGWENVHEIAEQLEHIHSGYTFLIRWMKSLNFPKYDPHGEPIPDKDGKYHRSGFKETERMRKAPQGNFHLCNYQSDDDFPLPIST